MDGAYYICPVHPELGWLTDRQWTRHESDGEHPSEMRVQTKYPPNIRNGEIGWTQYVRFSGPAPTTHEGWASMMSGVLGGHR